MERRDVWHRAKKTAAWTGAGLLSLAAVFALLCVLTYEPGRPALYPPIAEEDTVPVRVTLSYKWMHAELAVPRSLIEEAGGPAAQALEAVGEGEWIVLGWGDEDYYRERGITDHRLADFARSMLVPDSPAVLEYNPEPVISTPASTGKRVLALELSRAGAAALAARLNASFALSEGMPAAVGRGRDPGSQFFLAHDRSDLAFNCNHWIAELLNAAGVPQIGVLNTLSAGFAVTLTRLGGAKWVEGDRDAHRAGRETPPSHSGRYFPIAGHSALTADDLVFDGYALRLGGAVIDTAPAALVTAASSGLHDVLNVPGESLVGIRRIEKIYGARLALALCPEAEPTHIAIGYRPNDGGPYEIALAVYASDPASEPPPEPCATAWFRQP